MFVTQQRPRSALPVLREGPQSTLQPQGSGTHGMSFAGYTHGFVLQGGYSKDFTCAAGTDTCTLTAHGYTTNAAVYLTSTGTLPAPLKLRYDTKWAKHCIIRIDDNTFKLKWIPDSTDACSTVTTPITFTDSGTGTHSFWNGAGTLTLWPLAGYPQGTTFSYRRVASVQFAGLIGNNKPQFSYSDELTIYAKVPAVTPPGAYPITITTSESSASLKNQQTSGFTLYAKLLQPLSKAGPSSYPPIPGLALWENVLVRPDRGGGTDDGTHGYPYPRCPNPANPTFDVQYPSSGGQQIWFYDGGASYYEMEDYFKDPIWRNCGTHIASSIMATAVTSPTQGYFYAYTRTLQRAWAVTQDPRYKVALLRMSDPALGHPYTIGSMYDVRIREQSFSFARVLIRRRLTGVQSYFEGDYISSLVGMLDEISNGGTLYQFHQPFMAGLAMRELTDYYREHNDERIPVVIRQYLDRFWTDWYDKVKHRMYYNPDPIGDRCTVDCQVFTGSILNNLISPGFAFIWRLTGDDTYRVRGDDLFQYQFGPTFNTWPYQAKNWSEMNYWVWDYVRWRKGQQRAF